MLWLWVTHLEVPQQLYHWHWTSDSSKVHFGCPLHVCMSLRVSPIVTHMCVVVVFVWIHGCSQCMKKFTSKWTGLLFSLTHGTSTGQTILCVCGSWLGRLKNLVCTFLMHDTYRATYNILYGERATGGPFWVRRPKKLPYGRHFLLKSISLIWDSAVMLNFPMVAQSPYYMLCITWLFAYLQYSFHCPQAATVQCSQSGMLAVHTHAASALLLCGYCSMPKWLFPPYLCCTCTWAVGLSTQARLTCTLSVQISSSNWWSTVVNLIPMRPLMLACNSPMLLWREGSGKVSPNAVDPRCISVHAVIGRVGCSVYTTFVSLAALMIPLKDVLLSTDLLLTHRLASPAPAPASMLLLLHNHKG